MVVTELKRGVKIGRELSERAVANRSDRSSSWFQAGEFRAQCPNVCLRLIDFCLGDAGIEFGLMRIQFCQYIAGLHRRPGFAVQFGDDAIARRGDFYQSAFDVDLSTRDRGVGRRGRLRCRRCAISVRVRTRAEEEN